MRRARSAILVLLAAAAAANCGDAESQVEKAAARAPGRKAGTSFESITIDFRRDPKSPVGISATGVRVVRSGDDLKFDFLSTVTLYVQPDARGYRQPFRVTPRKFFVKLKKLPRRELLSDGSGELRVPAIDQKSPPGEIALADQISRNGAKFCEPECTVVAHLVYDGDLLGTDTLPAESIGGEVAESIPVTLNLATGRAALAVPAAVAVSRQVECRLLSVAEASQIFEQSMQANARSPDECAFNEPGRATTVRLQVDQDTASFYELTANPDAEMVDLGDRAVWDGKSTLYVIKGRRRLKVWVNSPYDARRKAVAIARLALPKI